MSYELILAAARSCDIAALTKILKRTTIDVWKPGKIHYSAISQLAQEKDKKAVEFLLQQGASLHCAALGAALTGDRAYCEELIARGANLNYAILGAILGNDDVYCEELIVRGAGLNWTILGAALGGKRAYCNMLIGRCASLDGATQSEGLEYAVMGAALGGDYAYCDMFIARGANINKAALYAALGGHYAYCEELIAQGANLNDVALGAAQGGEHAYCKKLVERGASLCYVVEGAAMGGHRAYCEELIALDAKLIVYVAMGAAMGGHRAYCEELIVLDAKLIGYVAMGAARCGNHAYCNELIQRGANLNYALIGAAEGSHHRYCEELLAVGAKIENAAMGAASGGDRVYCDILINRASARDRDFCLERAAYGAMQGGHYAYFESLIQRLIQRGASLYHVVHNLAGGSDVFKTEATTFYFLLHFENTSFRNALIATLVVSRAPVSEEIKEFLSRAKKQLQEIFYFKNKYDLSLQQARVMWENKKNINPLLAYMPGNREAKENINLLSLWVLQVMPQLLQGNADRERPALNVDILLHITRYLFPSLRMESFGDLSFKVIRHFLVASIDDYISPINPVSRLSNWLSSKQIPPRLHLARAESFQEEIKLTESKKELARLCIAQSVLFNKNNLTDEEGCTTLFYAVSNEITPTIVVQELLDNGAEPNIARKSDGETPLNLAVRNGNVKMVALLLDYGANPNQKNKANETTYDIAKQLDQDVAEKVVEILGRPIPRRVLQVHEEGVHGWQANDSFVEILEHTCARLG